MLIVQKLFHPEEWTDEDSDWLLGEITIELPFITSFKVKRVDILWLLATMQIEMIIMGYGIWLWRKIFRTGG